MLQWQKTKFQVHFSLLFTQSNKRIEYFLDVFLKSDLELISIDIRLVNHQIPFREDCGNTNYSIVHNKCYDTEDNICAVIRDGHLEFEIGERWKCPFITE